MNIDKVIILGGILASVFWMNGKFNEVDRRFSDIEKDMAIIKTVLVRKNIMPSELAIHNEYLKTE